MLADSERNKNLKDYCNSSGRKWDSRVHYQIDLQKKQSNKKKIMIIDESDERQFRNLQEFFN
jgi:hypothetical protein